MARKRLNVAKKRVLKKAASKNASFVVQSLSELKEENTINLESNASGKETMAVPTYNFDHHSDDEDVDMSEKPPLPTSQITRTYRRKKSVDQPLQDWETTTAPCEPSCSNPGPSIQIVHIESLYEQTNEAAGSAVNEAADIVILNPQTECSCGKSEDVDKCKALAESLQKDKDGLILKNAKLEAQNAKLLDSLTSKLLPTPEKPFKEEEGFIDGDALQRMSHEAGDKDYLFLKFIMMKLFPEGLVGRSVTGRASNNPSGRPKKIGDGISHDTREPTGNETPRETFKALLDPEKVKWIKRRLYDRRLFLGDVAATANACYRSAGRLMTRIIANASR